MKRSHLTAIWALTVAISIGIGVMIAPEKTGAAGFARASVTLAWYEVEQDTAISHWNPGWIFRAHIPGGWLVVKGVGGTPSGGITFVPDPDHEWR